MSAPTTVAVVGLGAMGSRIARRLVDAGLEVLVWNRSPEKARPLVGAGATAAQTPAEAAGAADSVITMVGDPAALDAVIEGHDGIAAAGRPVTVIQMSTIGQAALLRLPSMLPADSEVLDAPVLGSLPEAEAGSLRIFVGGSEELAARWQPLLSALGTPVHVGGLGAGSAAKLVANATLFGALGVLGEALALAGGMGLTREKAFDVLAATPLASQAERRRSAVEAGVYPPRFSLSLALKDADLVAEAAATAGVELRLAEAVRSWLAEAEARNWGELDYSAVLGAILGEDPRPPARPS